MPLDSQQSRTRKPRRKAGQLVADAEYYAEYCAVCKALGLPILWPAPSGVGRKVDKRTQNWGQWRIEREAKDNASN